MPIAPPPPEWPRMTSALFYRDAAAAIDWLCRAFGFVVRLRIEDDAGRILHSELEYGEGLVMIGQEGGEGDGRGWRAAMRSPLGLGGANTQSVMLYVDDAEGHCARARACGAEIVEEPSIHDYGAEHWTDRSYGARDCEGHLWWISQRIATGGAA